MAETGVDLARPGLSTTRLLRGLRRLHQEVADEHAGGLAHRRLHVMAHEPPDRKNTVVPFVGCIQITDDVEQMEFPTDFEHSCHRLGMRRRSPVATDAAWRESPISGAIRTENRSSPALVRFLRVRWTGHVARK